MWVGDVGENNWEEVDRVEAGRNYGWPIMEGAVCAPFDPSECDQTGLALPVWVYSHAVGNSITGGYVYRGSRIPVLSGEYLFADYATAQLWSVERNAPASAEHIASPFAVTTFGEDLEGELYVTDFFGGRIFKLTPGPGATNTSGTAPEPTALSLQVYPSPSRGVTTVRFTSEARDVRLVVYDLLGRRVTKLFDEQVGPNAERTVSFDTRSLVPGVYVLRLDAGGAVLTKKLVVTR